MQVNYNFNPFNPKEFQFYFSDIESVTTANLDEAMQKAAQKTKTTMSGLGISKAAVCLSGMDGELITHYLVNAGVDVECFTLNINDSEIEAVKYSKKICEKYNISHHVLSYSLDELFESGMLLEINEKSHARHYPYVTTALTAKLIPDNYYIIWGDGGLERTQPKYELLLNTNSDREFDLVNYAYVPIDAYTQAVGPTALRAYNKHGNTLWYTTSWDIWYHILKDPLLETNWFSYYNPTKVKMKAFGHIDLIFTEKTFARRTLQGNRNLVKIQHHLLSKKFNNPAVNINNKPFTGAHGCYIPIHKELLK